MQLDIYQAMEANDAMQACAAKAETFGFSTDAARAFVLNYLAAYGSSWGEAIVDAAKKTGRADLHAHDDRAFGSVFSSLARRGRIQCVEFGIRAKGRGTAGARRWSLAQ